MPAIGQQAAARSDQRVRARIGRAGVRARREIRPNKRGQIIHSQVEDALGVNTGFAYKNAPFAGPHERQERMGPSSMPAHVVHGVGHPDWSHRSYGLVDDEALDLS